MSNYLHLNGGTRGDGQQNWGTVDAARCWTSTSDLELVRSRQVANVRATRGSSREIWSTSGNRSYGLIIHLPPTSSASICRRMGQCTRPMDSQRLTWLRSVSMLPTGCG